MITQQQKVDILEICDCKSVNQITFSNFYDVYFVLSEKGTLYVFKQQNFEYFNKFETSFIYLQSLKFVDGSDLFVAITSEDALVQKMQISTNFDKVKFKKAQIFDMKFEETVKIEKELEWYKSFRYQEKENVFLIWDDANVNKFDLKKMKFECQIDNIEGQISSVFFSVQFQYFLIGTYQGHIEVWRYQLNEDLERDLFGHYIKPQYNQQENQIDGIKIFEGKLMGHTKKVTFITELEKQREIVVSYGADFQVKMWNLYGFQYICSIEVDQGLSQMQIISENNGFAIEDDKIIYFSIHFPLQFIYRHGNEVVQFQKQYLADQSKFERILIKLKNNSALDLKNNLNKQFQFFNTLETQNLQVLYPPPIQSEDLNSIQPNYIKNSFILQYNNQFQELRTDGSFGSQKNQNIYQQIDIAQIADAQKRPNLLKISIFKLLPILPPVYDQVRQQIIDNQQYQLLKQKQNDSPFIKWYKQLLQNEDLTYQEKIEQAQLVSVGSVDGYIMIFSLKNPEELIARFCFHKIGIRFLDCLILQNIDDYNEEYDKADQIRNKQNKNEKEENYKHYILSICEENDFIISGFQKGLIVQLYHIKIENIENFLVFDKNKIWIYNDIQGSQLFQVEDNLSIWQVNQDIQYQSIHYIEQNGETEGNKNNKKQTKNQINLKNNNSKQQKCKKKIQIYFDYCKQQQIYLTCAEGDKSIKFLNFDNEIVFEINMNKAIDLAFFCNSDGDLVLSQDFSLFYLSGDHFLRKIYTNIRKINIYKAQNETVIQKISFEKYFNKKDNNSEKLKKSNNQNSRKKGLRSFGSKILKGMKKTSFNFSQMQSQNNWNNNNYSNNNIGSQNSLNNSQNLSQSNFGTNISFNQQSVLNTQNGTLFQFQNNNNNNNNQEQKRNYRSISAFQENQATENQRKQKEEAEQKKKALLIDERTVFELGRELVKKDRQKLQLQKEKKKQQKKLEKQKEQENLDQTRKSFDESQIQNLYSPYRNTGLDSSFLNSPTLISPYRRKISVQDIGLISKTIPVLSQNLEQEESKNQYNNIRLIKFFNDKQKKIQRISKTVEIQQNKVRDEKFEDINKFEKLPRITNDKEEYENDDVNKNINLQEDKVQQKEFKININNKNSKNDKNKQVNNQPYNFLLKIQQNNEQKYKLPIEQLGTVWVQNQKNFLRKDLNQNLDQISKKQKIISEIEHVQNQIKQSRIFQELKQKRNSLDQNLLQKQCQLVKKEDEFENKGQIFQKYEKNKQSTLQNNQQQQQQLKEKQENDQIIEQQQFEQDEENIIKPKFESFISDRKLRRKKLISSIDDSDELKIRQYYQQVKIENYKSRNISLDGKNYLFLFMILQL
ncbi:WD40-repeat-containing domain [Pseudocohnilembus persalinus]|uniref:WD40-repeat-containing domain n=1 Tax=Pseudocohnilembus persalinus TaxID=266149 RepID=A0A0V0QWY5_PSEPJ|nr:WD40-repeat-containing domain [Pseudocohnilembus persalinus]|eukprot:KRX06831.1 WD40-repeat-containing domain [Pseudocohnilembus persalinus]